MTSGNADDANELTAEIAHRHGRAAHLFVELAVIEADARRPHVLDLLHETLSVDDRLRRERLQFDAIEIAVELLRPQRGQDHAARITLPSCRIDSRGQSQRRASSALLQKDHDPEQRERRQCEPVAVWTVR